jgi:hypothetical protein
MSESFKRPQKSKTRKKAAGRKVRKDPFLESFSNWMERMAKDPSKENRIAAIREAADKRDGSAIPALLFIRLSPIIDMEERIAAADALGKIAKPFPVRDLVIALGFHIKDSAPKEKASVLMETYGLIRARPNAEEFMELVPLFCEAIEAIKGVHVISDRLLDLLKLQRYDSSEELIEKVLRADKSVREAKQELDGLKKEFELFHADSELMAEVSLMSLIEGEQDKSEEVKSAIRRQFSQLRPIFPDLSILEFDKAIMAEGRIHTRLMVNPKLGSATIAAMCLKEIAAAIPARREEIVDAVKPVLADLEKQDDPVRTNIRNLLYLITGQAEPHTN